MATRSCAEWMGRMLDASRRCWSGLWRLEARFRGCVLGRDVQFVGRPILGRMAGSRLELGDDVCVASALRANPLGCFQPCVLRTLSPQAELVLEKNVGISGAVFCAASSIRVGEGTIVGSGAMIIDTDFHQPIENWRWDHSPEQVTKPIRIGRGVFVGARAIILKGVTIGDRAVIGAGAVVTRDVPAEHIAVGNPARIMPPKKPSA